METVAHFSRIAVRAFSLAIILVLVHFALPAVGQEASALPPDAAAAQADYLAQRRKGLLQLNDRYVAKLNEILVVHTRSGQLERALAVRAEIARIEEENASLKIEGPPPVGVKPEQAAEKPVLVSVEASEERGTTLAGVGTGDRLALQYVSGKWKNHGVLASEKPDGPSPQRGEENRLAIFGRKEGATRPVHLAVVPPGTEQKPFEFVVPPGYQGIFLRLNEDPDGQWRDNPGTVVYQVTIKKPGR